MLLLIANEALLGPERQDHPLKGEWARTTENAMWAVTSC